MILGMDADKPCAASIPLIQAANYKYVGRYYSNLKLTHVPEKVLTAKEASLLCAAGLKLFVVWEFRNDASYFTHDQGIADANDAYNYGSKVIKQPFGSAIFFAVDFDASDKQYKSEIAPYFQGVRDALGQKPNNARYAVGAYASGAICKSLKADGLIKYQWLACATAWRGTKGYTSADLYQRNPIHPPNWPFGYEPDDTPKWGFGEFTV